MQAHELPYSIRQRLGHAPDHELAEEAKCSVLSIITARAGLGLNTQNSIIEEFTRQPAINSSAKEMNPRCTLSQEVIDALGTMPDRKLARLVGRAESTIRTQRTSRGIPPFSSDDRKTLNENVIAALGTMPDSELARISGRSESSIRTARTRK